MEFQQASQWVYDLIFSIWMIAGLIAILGLCIFLAIWAIMDERERREYVKDLSDHDKAVIQTYKSISWLPKKKKKFKFDD